MKIISDNDFASEVEASSGYVLVDFFAPWCGPCVALTPAIEKISSNFIGKLKVLKMNVDDSPEASGKFRIASIPTMILFKDGVVVDTIVGSRSYDQMESWINKIMSAE